GSRNEETAARWRVYRGWLLRGSVDRDRATCGKRRAGRRVPRTTGDDDRPGPRTLARPPDGSAPRLGGPVRPGGVGRRWGGNRSPWPQGPADSPRFFAPWPGKPHAIV